MWTIDRLFEVGDKERIWQKYCGFLDLSLEVFMRMQRTMLLQQIEIMADTPHGKHFMPKTPKSVAEYRSMVSLTTYDDYARVFADRDEQRLDMKPYCWARTSGRGGEPKWIPFNDAFMEINILYCITTLLLACAERRGQVLVGKGARILQNLPPEPYGAAYYARAAAQQVALRLIPDPDSTEFEDFSERTEAGFEIALRSGVDVLTSLSSVIVKTGERFTDSSHGMKLSLRMLEPRLLFRVIRAFIRSKREHRSLLPKDLWPLKGLIAYGMDTEMYRDRLIHYWGRAPLQIYAATEVGLIGTQAWNKKFMTFTPSSAFWEFIPDEERGKALEDSSYSPKTVLVDELRPGEIYEIVASSLHGMPFFRYRLGDLIRVMGREDTAAGIALPQFEFYSRVGDLIDLSGLARLDEKTVWEALDSTGAQLEDWSLRKEFHDCTETLHLYVETKHTASADSATIMARFDEQLGRENEDYRGYKKTLGVDPLRVTVLSPGTFQRYYESKKREGVDLAYLSPPHMNASDEVVEMLLRQSQMKGSSGQ